MTEDEARAAELVRAIEAEDGEALLLTREDRDQAETHARFGQTNRPGERRAGDRFMADRAQFAAERLATRHPGIAGLLERSRWPRWIGIALPLAALLAGFLANELGTAHRLELLAAPLLGTIGWNILVYLWIALSALTGRGRIAADPVSRAVAALAAIRQRDFDRGTALHRAAGAFQARWSRRAAPLTAARIARTLHLGAALFAAGLIGGIYLRALVIEYRAGWESTFLDPAAVRALLGAVLGPASAVTGVPIPPLADIAAMRWPGPGLRGGVNAGPWIHLYTATIAGLVIAPRLALAAWQAIRAFRLARDLPGPGREDFYVRRLLRAAGTGPGTARVTPYAYRPDAATRDTLSAALRAALGDAAAIRFDEPLDYGAEESWLARFEPRPDDDYHILLFTMAATPEAENHGVLARSLAAALRRDHPGILVSAIVDEGPFRAHFHGQPGLDARIASRFEAWRAVLGGAGIGALALDLSRPPDDALVRRLEAGLMPDGAMRG